MYEKNLSSIETTPKWMNWLDKVLIYPVYLIELGKSSGGPNRIMISCINCFGVIFSVNPRVLNKWNK